MTISRGQMNRQLYMGGGIMNARPRQKFFLGGIGDSIKDLGKKAVSGIKDIAKSDIGKAALLYGATAGLGSIGSGLTGMARFAPSNFMGNVGRIGSFITGGFPGNNIVDEVALTGKKNIFQKALGAVTGGGITGNLGKFATLGAVTTFLTSTLGMSEEQAEEEVARDPSKYLSLYYKNLNPKASEEEVQEFVTSNTSEYAEGGRIGYALGSDELPPDPTTPVNPFKPKPIGPVLPNKAENVLSFEEFLEGKQEFMKQDNLEKLIEDYKRYLRDLQMNQARDMVAGGGIMNRMNYALGDTASQNAMQAASIEGLPMRQNPKGVQELDLRDKGGFIPPVGIKEKEDDIPAMLSNNEFVFTADAVRGMGDGDVELGAQRMYDQMKMLEAGGKV